MYLHLTRLALTLLTTVALALPCFAGALDDHYLAAFGQRSALPTASALQKALLLPGSSADSVHCGTPLKHGLQRDWNNLESATRKTLAKQLAAPVLSGPELTLRSPSGRFTIHYTTSGVDAVPSFSWVQTVAQTFDDVATSYLGRGWSLAPTAAGIPYDIYLSSLASQLIYGQTTSTAPMPSSGFPNAFASFIEIDKDFTNTIYTKPNNNGVATYTPLQSLQITAAHEYHHAIQYGYNFFFDIWYAEATSTWHEDELYDAVNQLYNYVPAWFRNSDLSLDLAVDASATSTGAGYSRWIFNRFLAERYSSSVVRTAWETLAPLNSTGGADIPMAPILDGILRGATFNSTLSSEFFAFAKRVYTRDWSSHIADLSLIHPYVPVTSFTSYPVSTTQSAIVLPHYSFAYYSFTPIANIATLRITTSRTSGISMAVFKKSGSTITSIPIDSDGITFTVTGFSALNAAAGDEVVLLSANVTTVDNHQSSFSTDGSGTALPEPTVPVAVSGGGGGGCFIATAAYGSYLHPQVKVLRAFRDHYLLTNTPGRAFVALYYRVSPPLADFIARHDTLRAVTRLLLTPLILAIAHPGLALASLLLAGGALYVPLRRRWHTVAVGAH